VGGGHCWMRGGRTGWNRTVSSPVLSPNLLGEVGGHRRLGAERGTLGRGYAFDSPWFSSDYILKNIRILVPY
jgi:hypothetical protein